MIRSSQIPEEWENKEALLEMAKFVRDWRAQKNEAESGTKKMDTTVPRPSPLPLKQSAAPRPATKSMFPDNFRQKIIDYVSFIGNNLEEPCTALFPKSSAFPRLQKFAQLHEAGVSFSDRNLINGVMDCIEAYMEGECPHFCRGRPLAEQAHAFMDKRPVKTEDEKRLQEALRASTDQMDNECFPVPESEDEDSECGEEEEEDDDVDVVSLAERILHLDDNVKMSTSDEMSLEVVILNRKGFMESMSAAIKRLKESPATAKRTVQMGNLYRIIGQMEGFPPQVKLCRYGIDMYQNCFAALTDPSTPKQEMEQPMTITVGASSFRRLEGEDEDSECEEEGEEEEDEEDDDDESPSELLYADENVTLRTLNERRLQAIIFNVKGFLESMSAAVKRLERSPTTAKRTVQIENLNRIIVEMESVRGQLHVCLYPYDMYENCFIALTDPSKTLQAL